MLQEAMVGIVTQEEMEKLFKGEISHEDLIDKACKRIDADPELQGFLDKMMKGDSKYSNEEKMKFKKADAVLELTSQITEDTMESLEITTTALSKMALSDLTRVTSLKRAIDLVEPSDSVAILGFVYDMLGCRNLAEARFKIATALHMICSEVAEEIEKDAKKFVKEMHEKECQKNKVKPENKVKTEKVDPLQAALQSILKEFNN